MEKEMKTGTTTLGIKCSDGIILAADKRATAGYLIAQKDTDKIENITDNIAVTMAGSASDGQMNIRLLKAELNLRKIRNGKEITVKEAANLMARMVYYNIRRPSMLQSISHFVMAGVDSSGCYLYDIFPDGTISECKEFISSGSGSVMAYGVLETLYDSKMDIKEGQKLALKCVNAALQRDIASGNGIDIYSITKKGGAVKIFHKELDTRIHE